MSRVEESPRPSPLVSEAPAPRASRTARLKGRFQRAPKPWEEILFLVGGAIVLSFLLDALIEPPETALQFFGRVVGSIVRIAFAVLFGVWLGRRVWPKRGERLAARVLRRMTTRKVKPILVLTHRPDFMPRAERRIVEVVGFAAGASILLASILALAGATALTVTIPSGLFVLLALWASFVLVPYWAFAGLGLRRVDPVRWAIEPVSRRYAQKFRLSNGALLLIATGVTLNLLFRAGLSGDEALLAAVRLVGHLVAAILVVAASGVAYYRRAERAVLVSLEKRALELGVRDARDLTDGDFLPRFAKP